MSERSHVGPVPPVPRAAGTAPQETGWLPDCVYTDGRFETGLAFFADARGKITRFSREPADVSAARRLGGQAALPGLINGHARSWRRVLRGRGADAVAAAAGRLEAGDLYDVARMAYMEMLLHGTTCVAEFHTLLHQPDGSPSPEPNATDRALLRAATDTGIRLALFKVAGAHDDPRTADDVPNRCLTPDADRFLRDLDALRDHVAHDLPGDDTWVGAGLLGVCHLPPEYVRAVGDYAHTQRMRLHVSLSARGPDHDAGVAERSLPAIETLGRAGLVDKRLTAIHAAGLSDAEVRDLGAARASVCLCPTTARRMGKLEASVRALLTAGAGVSLGADPQLHVDLLEDARHLGDDEAGRREAPASLNMEQRFHAATVAGARSLGAPSGALEVGRPADFFTVNLYDPSLAGAHPETLLDNILYSLERRAIREVWVGARRCVVGGRHDHQGAVVNRFVELQRRLWGQ